MASTFKSFLNSDITTTRTLLHESIPLTGSIVARTYGAAGAETNVKTFGHGQFQSVYDYPYLSSSANHIFDITAGIHDAWPDDPVTSQKALKENIYAQMAQLLVGFDATGTVRRFDKDGNFSDTTNDKYNACAFISFSRLLVKDEIKKGTFEMHIGVKNGTVDGYTLANLFSDGVNAAQGAGVMRIYDKGAADEFRVNSPVGEYGLLYAAAAEADRIDGPDNADAGDDVVDPDAATADSALAGHVRVGLIYYQAGIVVLNLDIFKGYQNGQTGILHHAGNAVSPGANASLTWYRDTANGGADKTLVQTLQGYTLDAFAEGLRHRIYNISFNNTTELNSTIYFCRANHNEFNYSSNPTYLSGSKIRVKRDSTDQPVSYLTSVGLYSADNELLAVAKLSEPLKKDPTNELTLRVRLDY